MVIIKVPGTNLTIPLWPSYHIPQNPQHTISPNAIKHYNNFRTVHTEHLKHITLVNNTGIKEKILFLQKYINNVILDFINVDLMTMSNSNYNTYSTKLTANNHDYTNVIVNKSSFKKMSNIDRTLIHRRLMHLGNKTIDLMCKEAIMEDLPKSLPTHHPDKFPCIICWTTKSNNPSKPPTIDILCSIPGGLIHMDFTFYNITSIRGFISALNIIDASTRKLWTFVLPDKRPPLYQISFFFTYLKKINRPCNEIRVDKGGELAQSTEFTELLIDANINLQRTGGYSSWMNGQVERSHQTTSKMVRAAIKDSNQSTDKWCYALETCVDVYNSIRHRTTCEQPHYAWYNKRTSIHDFRVWGCAIYPRSHNHKKLDDRTLQGFFMGYTNTRSIIKWWDPKTDKVNFCMSAQFIETT